MNSSDGDLDFCYLRANDRGSGSGSSSFPSSSSSTSGRVPLPEGWKNGFGVRHEAHFESGLDRGDTNLGVILGSEYGPTGGVVEAIATTQSSVVAVLCHLTVAGVKQRTLFVWDYRKLRQEYMPSRPLHGSIDVRACASSLMSEELRPQVAVDLHPSKYASLGACDIRYAAGSEEGVCLHAALASSEAKIELVTVDLECGIVVRHIRTSAILGGEAARVVRVAQACLQLLYGCLVASTEGPCTVCIRDGSLCLLHVIRWDRGGDIAALCFATRSRQKKTNDLRMEATLVLCCEKGYISGWSIDGLGDDDADGVRRALPPCRSVQATPTGETPPAIVSCLFEYSIKLTSSLRSIAAHYDSACEAHGNYSASPQLHIATASEDSKLWLLLAKSRPVANDEGYQFSCTELRCVDLQARLRAVGRVAAGVGGEAGAAISRSGAGIMLALSFTKAVSGELLINALLRSYLVIIDSKMFNLRSIVPLADEDIAFATHGSFASSSSFEDPPGPRETRIVCALSKLFDTERSPFLLRVDLPSLKEITCPIAPLQDNLDSPAFKEASHEANIDSIPGRSVGSEPIISNTLNKVASSGVNPLSFFSSALAREAAFADAVAENAIDPLVDLPDESPLRFEFHPPKTPEMHVGAMRSQSKGRASGVSWEQGGRVDKSTGKLISLPVTFHERIKSSGYGNQTKPKPHRASSAPRRMAEVGGRRSSSSATKVLQKYPSESGPPLIAIGKNDYPAPGTASKHPGPLHALCMSEDGRWAGLVSENAVLETIRLPVNKHPDGGICYMGHNGRLTSVHFSHDNGMVMSSSEDGTARLWRIGRVESPAVVFSHRLSHPRLGAPGKLGLYNGLAALTSDDNFGGNVQVGGAKRNVSASSSQERNKPFGAPVVAARFFYMDKFAMIASKSSVFMYAFDTEGTDASNDIKRLQSFGKYRLVAEFNHDAVRISSFSCINSVQSVLCVSATTDRHLHFLDAAVGATVRRVECAHERAIHCIALPQPSIHASVAPDNLNLFATAAIDNTVNLWDVRGPSAIGRYSGHVNRREDVQCALSPCMRYLATGSEDRSARLVDLRSLREVGRVGQGVFRDVVAGVAFHPLSPQLAACSFDGKVRFFGPSDAASLIM